MRIGAPCSLAPPAATTTSHEAASEQTDGERGAAESDLQRAHGAATVRSAVHSIDRSIQPHTFALLGRVHGCCFARTHLQLSHACGHIQVAEQTLPRRARHGGGNCKGEGAEGGAQHARRALQGAAMAEQQWQ